MRRAVGYRLERAGSWLPDFASFMEQRGSEFITTELALEWATRSRIGVLEEQGVLRWFDFWPGIFRPMIHGPQFPTPGLLTYRGHRQAPHVYSTEEIESLLHECRRLKGALTRHTYATLIGLLAVTGMRVGEALNLDCSDIDERGLLITVRKGKFGKSRELPVHASTIDALKAYAKRRDRLFRHPKPELLPVPERKTVVACKRLENIQPSSTLDRSRRPRTIDPPHSRSAHTFAVRTLLQWSATDRTSSLALLSFPPTWGMSAPPVPTGT